MCMWRKRYKNETKCHENVTFWKYRKLMQLGVQVQNKGIMKNASNEICHEIGKITNVTFRHKWVIKTKFPQNLDHTYFSRWKTKNKMKLRFWKKSSIFDFEIFSDFDFFLKIFEIFQILRFFQTFQDFSRFSDFQISDFCGKIFRWFPNFEIFQKTIYFRNSRP